MKNYGKMAKSMIYGKSAWFMAKAIAVFKIQVRITWQVLYADPFQLLGLFLPQHTVLKPKK